MPLTATQQARLSYLEDRQNARGLTAAEVLDYEVLQSLAHPIPPTPKRGIFRLGAGPSPGLGGPEFTGDPYRAYKDASGVRWVWNQEWTATVSGKKR